MGKLVNWYDAPCYLCHALALALTLAATLVAQPRLTLDYPAMARRIVQQLALKPGERVMSLAHPGVFEDLLPYIRYEVMRAGGIDLGVVEVLREPVPESFDAAVLAERRARGAGALQGDVPRRGRRDHDAGRDHVASGVSRDAGLAEGRPRPSIAAGGPSTSTGSRTAARIRSPVSRCRRVR